MATSNLLTFTSSRYKLPPPASCVMSSAFRACKACVNVLSWLHFKNVHLETSRNSEKAFLAPSLLQKDPCYDKSEFFWCGLSQWAFSELLPWNYGWDIPKQQSCDSMWLATSRNGCLLLLFSYTLFCWVKLLLLLTQSWGTWRTKRTQDFVICITWFANPLTYAYRLWHTLTCRNKHYTFTSQHTDYGSEIKRQTKGGIVIMLVEAF